MTWEVLHNLLEEEHLRPLEKKATVDAQESYDPSYFERTWSFLHRIAAQPKISPYTDMVKCVIDEVEIADRTFKNHRQVVMGSFSVDNLRLMY